MSAMRKVTLNIYYGNRVSVVVRGRESRPHGEGRQSFFNMLWSSVFVTLMAKKYHKSITLNAEFRTGYDNR